MNLITSYISLKSEKLSDPQNPLSLGYFKRDGQHNPNQHDKSIKLGGTRHQRQLSPPGLIQDVKLKSK